MSPKDLSHPHACTPSQHDFLPTALPSRPAAAATYPPVDPAPLLAFKATFTNGAAVLADWSAATNPCLWSGVICERGVVTEL